MMVDKPYSKVGDTYYPKKNIAGVRDREIVGNVWRAWEDDGEYYFEYDYGHFSTEIRVLKISERHFKDLKMREITGEELARELCRDDH